MLLMPYTITKHELNIHLWCNAVQHTFVEGEENREVISCHSNALAPIAVFPTVPPQTFFLGVTSTPRHSLECQLIFPYREPALAGP